MNYLLAFRDLDARHRRKSDMLAQKHRRARAHPEYAARRDHVESVIARELDELSAEQAQERSLLENKARMSAQVAVRKNAEREERWSVPCTSCGARAGSPCRTRNDVEMVVPHKPRIHEVNKKKW